MCVGLLPVERLTRARATLTGGLLVLYGATTGRDGIGGASVLASAELAEEDADKRPTVQIGDPFTGKKLIESSLELVERGLVESLQDCGAAGLASSLAEMARDGAGVDVDLDRVPLREDEMEAWEIMVSESQERMVAVVSQSASSKSRQSARWAGTCRDRRGDRHWGAPLLPRRRAGRSDPRGAPDGRMSPLRGRGQPRETTTVPVADSNLTSRRWIYERYDQLVGSRTVRRPGLDAAVLRLEGNRGLAVSLDGPPVGERDPFRAGALAVLDAARNVACAGGEPIGLTDCLNFGNPEKPEIGWELEQAIEGIAQAAEALGIPVVSGNVSLYNDTDGRSIPPTPVVGCVGLVPDVRRVPRGWRRGDTVSVVREASNKLLLGEIDLAHEAELIGLVWRAAAGLSLVHDVSDGGLETAFGRWPNGRGRGRPGHRRPDTVRFVLAGDHVPDFAEEVGEI